MDDFAERVRAKKLRTGTYDLCLDEDLVAEYERLVDERDRAMSAKRDSLAGGAAPELDEQIGAVLEQMQEATQTLTFKALSRPRWRELMDAYPPRLKEDGSPAHRGDMLLGVNVDAFFDRVVRLSLVAPKMDEETLTILIEESLTDRQWEEITDVVWNLNRAKVNLPFSSSGSQPTRTSSPK
jgi:hypothetical protein